MWGIVSIPLRPQACGFQRSSQATFSDDKTLVVREVAWRNGWPSDWSAGSDGSVINAVEVGRNGRVLMANGSSFENPVQALGWPVTEIECRGTNATNAKTDPCTWTSARSIDMGSNSCVFDNFGFGETLVFRIRVACMIADQPRVWSEWSEPFDASTPIVRPPTWEQLAPTTSTTVTAKWSPPEHQGCKVTGYVFAMRSLDAGGEPDWLERPCRLSKLSCSGNSRPQQKARRFRFECAQRQTWQASPTGRSTCSQPAIRLSRLTSLGMI